MIKKDTVVSQSKLFEVMGLGPVWQLRPEFAQASQVTDEAPEAHWQAADHQSTSLSLEPLPTAVAQPADSLAQSPSHTLEELARTVANCTACGLCKTRKQTVFSAGVAGAELMIVGEAPGADEDAQGQPFVGRAGQLLDKMLQATGRSRARDTYIANVLKCRPPGNRNPEAEEIAKCSPFLMQQIELNQPKALLLAGSFAIRTLLNTQDPVGKLRGRVHHVEVGGRVIPAVATYHPAYLLRNPVEKRKSWADLLLLQSLLK